MFNKIASWLRGQPEDIFVGLDEEFEKEDDPRTGAERRMAEALDAEAFDAILAGELQAAKKIQMGLVPKTFPPIPGCRPFDLYALLESAKEIGGDFYDFWLNGRERLVLVVGDVSGKGIPAALFMAICRTYLRAFSRAISEPAKLVQYLNDEVSRHNDACMFVTLLCAVVNIPTGEVEYANAGHNPIFLNRADGETIALEASDNMVVGIMPGMEFKTQKLVLAPGDSLLLYTDGMPEAFNPDGAMLGEERSLEMFREAAGGGSCRSVVAQLRAEIAEFADGADQSDDITLLMYRQADQSAGMDLSASLNAAADPSDMLAGDTAMISFSGINAPLSKLAAGGGTDIGRSLSGITASGNNQ